MFWPNDYYYFHFMCLFNAKMHSINSVNWSNKLYIRNVSDQYINLIHDGMKMDDKCKFYSATTILNEISNKIQTQQ